MQVPEKLALIGGSILLSSTLIFTLKSQASTILPTVGHSVSGIFDHINDTQKRVDFADAFKNAQQQGWKTGQWGTSKYYIEPGGNLHIGKGELEDNLFDTLGPDVTKGLTSISIDQPVQAPQDSKALFSTSKLFGYNESNLTAIYGLDNVDTSQVTNMLSIFCNDFHLTTVEGIDKWDTSNVQSFGMAFMGTSLRNIDLSGWQDSNVNDIRSMFATNNSLHSINISNLNINQHHAQVDGLFGGGSSNFSYDDKGLSNITLGGNTSLSNIGYFPDGTWQNGNQSSSANQLIDGNAHPGTWVKQ